MRPYAFDALSFMGSRSFAERSVHVCIAISLNHCVEKVTGTTSFSVQNAVRPCAFDAYRLSLFGDFAHIAVNYLD